jgi:hypothetical protein
VSRYTVQYKLRDTSLRVKRYELQGTTYEVQVMRYKVQVTRCELLAELGKIGDNSMNRQ